VAESAATVSTIRRKIREGKYPIAELVDQIRRKGTHYMNKSWVSEDAIWVSTFAPINFPTCPNEPGYNSGAGCNATISLPTSQGFKSRHPFRMREDASFRTPGCASRPRALELNAFGVREVVVVARLAEKCGQT
jgi:hypothetical protein